MKTDKKYVTVNISMPIWKLIVKNGKFGESVSDVLSRLFEKKHGKK